MIEIYAWGAFFAFLVIGSACILANAIRKSSDDNPYNTGEAYDPFGYEFGDMPATPITDLHGGDNR
jgi:hypothetical protein